MLIFKLQQKKFLKILLQLDKQFRPNPGLEL